MSDDLEEVVHYALGRVSAEILVIDCLRLLGR